MIKNCDVQVATTGTSHRFLLLVCVCVGGGCSVVCSVCVWGGGVGGGVGGG